jgi:hypothetical protein
MTRPTAAEIARAYAGWRCRRESLWRRLQRRAALLGPDDWVGVSAVLLAVLACLLGAFA